MTSKIELSYLSTVELARLIRDRDVSCVEVIETFIRRIEERNKSLNSFVYCGFDEAVTSAIAADKTLSKGDDVGPLHGVPTAIKDLIDFKPGWPATIGGIRALQNNRAEETSPYAKRLEDAGAIIVGMTNAPVMGFRGTADNYLFGPTCNPFDVSKNSGGSSGGSAAAVADGLIPFAEGTDGGGSIRIPASWCGVYGFQASFGRIPFISRPNAFGGDAPFLYSGPITRTVDDAALALSAVSGYDARDPYSLVGTCDFVGATSKSIEGSRIAYSRNLDVFPVDPEVTSTIEASINAIRDSGIDVDEIELGIEYSHDCLTEAWIKLILPFAVTGFEGLRKAGVDILKDSPSDVPPELRKWLDIGFKMTALEFFEVQEIRTHIFDAIQTVFETYDYLITPTMACLPVDNSNDGNTLGPSEINGEKVDNLIGYCLTYFTNFSGHPAASIPAGLSKSGLPVGMQIIGKRCADEALLAMSAYFEKIKPWREDYTVCESRVL
jgi:amidase